MRRGLILINSYATLPSLLNQSYRMRDELEAQGISMDVERTDIFAATIRDNDIATVGGYDFVIFHDKDKYVGAMLEKAGMRLFNSSKAVEDCDDKMTTYIRLAGEGLPIVDSMAGLLCFTPDAPLSERAVDRVEETFGYPVIVKECYGSLGKGVHKCDSRAELVDTMTALKCTPHLFQRYVATSSGRDIRVIVVGDKCVAAMLRESDADFRSNIELGGHGSPCEITPEIERIALGAVRVLGLDYAGIDLLFSDNGLVICEVNSNAFFGGIEAVTGVNVAKAYADYIVEEVYNEDAITRLREHQNYLSITLLGIERVQKNLGSDMTREEIISLAQDIIRDDASHLSHHGKNYYIERDGIRFTINASTMMIITATRVGR